MKGFGPGRIRTVVSMATDSSHRLTMEKTYKNLLPQSPELSYFVCSNAPGLHTGPAPGASWGKHKKNLLLRNHKAQSFHILYVAMFSGPLYKSSQSCSWGQKWPRPGCH